MPIERRPYKTIPAHVLIDILQRSIKDGDPYVKYLLHEIDHTDHILKLVEDQSLPRIKMKHRKDICSGIAEDIEGFGILGSDYEDAASVIQKLIDCHFDPQSELRTEYWRSNADTIGNLICIRFFDKRSSATFYFMTSNQYRGDRMRRLRDKALRDKSRV